jgi:hypothetical protein
MIADAAMLAKKMRSRKIEIAVFFFMLPRQ